MAYDLRQQRPAKAAQLIFFSVEVRLVDGEAVDQLLRLGIAVLQQCVVGRELRYLDCGHSFYNAALNVKALAFSIEKSGAAVEKLAKPCEVRRAQ